LTNIVNRLYIERDILLIIEQNGDVLPENYNYQSRVHP